jgi:hypothetical protein
VVRSSNKLFGNSLIQSIPPPNNPPIIANASTYTDVLDNAFVNESIKQTVTGVAGTFTHNHDFNLNKVKITDVIFWYGNAGAWAGIHTFKIYVEGSLIRLYQFNFTTSEYYVPLGLFQDDLFAESKFKTLRVAITFTTTVGGTFTTKMYVQGYQL